MDQHFKTSICLNIIESLSIFKVIFENHACVFSLIWDTDWLIHSTWSTNIVFALPRAAEEEHWSIPHIFSRKQMANELAILRFNTMLTVLAGAFYCAHSTMDTRCTVAHSTIVHFRKSPLKKIWLRGYE